MGNVYVTGDIMLDTISFGVTHMSLPPSSSFYTGDPGIGTVDRTALFKFDASGNPKWCHVASGEYVDEVDLGESVATDTLGNIYISVFSGHQAANFLTFDTVTVTTSGGHDFILAKYDSSGTIQWATDVPDAGDFNSSICMGPFGNIYVTSNTDIPDVYFGTHTFDVGGHVGEVGAVYVARWDNPIVTPSTPITGNSPVCVGSTLSLTDAATGGGWSSSNTSVATINSTTGLVSALAAGTATISYTVAGASTTAIVTVDTTPNAGTISGPATICQTATGTIFSASGSGGTWASAYGDVTLEASTGNVTSIYEGNTIDLISYTVTNACGTSTTTSYVNIDSNTPIDIEFSGPSTICVGGTTSLYIPSAGYYTVDGYWTSDIAGIGYGDGYGVNLSTYGSGVGTVTFNYTNTCGAMTSSLPITVNPAFYSGGYFYIDQHNLCVGSGTFALYNPGIVDPPNTDSWSSSNPAIADVDEFGNISAYTPGIATITYTQNFGSCGSGTVTATVNVNATPDAGTITGPTTVCIGGSSTLADTATGGTWASSNTAVATVGTTTGIVTGIASGDATISYTKASGSCTAMSTISVNVGSPVAAITGPNSVCTGTVITLADANTGGTWASSATAKATVNSSGVVTGVAAGTATISYTATNTCGTNTVTYPVTINASPNTITGTGVVCVGATAALGETTTGGTWSSGSTDLATVSTTGTVTGVATGNPVISYTLSSGCYKTFVTTVNVTPVAITGTTSVCAGNTTSLTDATTGGKWYSSNTSLATVDSMTGLVTSIATGTPIISYRLSDGCYKTATITVGSSLSTAITGTPQVCVGNVTTLANATSGGTWSSGSTGIATIAGTGIVSGVSAGTATVTYTKSGCFVTQIVTVNTNPLTSISGPSAVCSGNTITLTNSTAGGAWTTSAPSIATVDGSTGILSGISAGTSYIIYTLSTGCYKNQLITVNGTPPAAISGSNQVCTGGNITSLTDATTGGTWTSSAATVATVSSAGVVTGVAGGTATITYTKTGCFVIQPITVNVNALAANTGPAAVCVGYTVTLANSTTGGTWSSNNTSLATIDAGTGMVIGVATGSPVITYTSAIGCYKNSNITIGNNVIAAITGPGTACVGGLPITLADANIVSPSWVSGNTSVATISSSGVVTGVATGTANITYSATSACGATASVTTAIAVGGASVGAITGAASVCNGGSTTLTDTTSGGTWSSSNAALASIDASGVVSGHSLGSITITYTATTSCGLYAVTTPITINTSTPAAIAGTGTVCVAGHVTLTNSVTGGTWSTSDATVATINTSGLITGVAAGTSTVTYTVTNACGTGTATKTITVNNAIATPIVGLGNVCLGSTITLTDSMPGGTWSSSSATLASVSTSGVVTGLLIGNPIISYSYTNGCGTVTATKTLTLNTVNPLSPIITTIAGNGVYGFSGDGGAATAAQLHTIGDILKDGAGNIYFTDQFNYRVRKISTSGIISTIAGNDIGGYSGDGGPATAASFNLPCGLALDGYGNLYVTDNSRVRKISSTGIVTTVAGNGTNGYSGDGVAATATSLNHPSYICIDNSGNLYIADNNNFRIRKVDNSGVITTVVGNGVNGYLGDGGIAVNAEISSVTGIKVDNTGNLYFADAYPNNRIRKLIPFRH